MLFVVDRSLEELEATFAGRIFKATPATFMAEGAAAGVAVPKTATVYGGEPEQGPRIVDAWIASSKEVSDGRDGSMCYRVGEEA